MYNQGSGYIIQIKMTGLFYVNGGSKSFEMFWDFGGFQRTLRF